MCVRLANRINVSVLVLTKDTLNGLLPVAEDWHAKVCLIEVGDL